MKTKKKKIRSPLPPPRIDVIELATGNCIHSVQLQSTNERAVERILLGMLTNMDTEKYAAHEVLK